MAVDNRRFLKNIFVENIFEPVIYLIEPFLAKAICSWFSSNMLENRKSELENLLLLHKSRTLKSKLLFN